MKTKIKNAVLRLRVRFYKWQARMNWEHRYKGNWFTQLRRSSIALHYYRRFETLDNERLQRLSKSHMRRWAREQGTTAYELNAILSRQYEEKMSEGRKAQENAAQHS